MGVKSKMKFLKVVRGFSPDPDFIPIKITDLKFCDISKDGFYLYRNKMDDKNKGFTTIFVIQNGWLYTPKSGKRKKWVDIFYENLRYRDISRDDAMAIEKLIDSGLIKYDNQLYLDYQNWLYRIHKRKTKIFFRNVLKEMRERDF